MKKIRKFFNLYVSPHKKLTRQLRGLLGFTPANLSVFRLAFKHSSRSSDAYTSNERLEYLGDAILDSVISDYLFKKYPKRGEGFLTEMRSKIVNRQRLGEIGDQLSLQDFLDYDKGYVRVNGTILGNALEALIGAIYLDAGYGKTKQFVFKKMLAPFINLDNLQNSDINYKSRLFEWAQKYDYELEFKVLEEKKNGNIRIFVVGAYVEGIKQGVGEGRNKKSAQKQAARVVYEKKNVGEDLLK